MEKREFLSSFLCIFSADMGIDDIGGMVNPPSEMLWIGECELEVMVAVPSEMVVYVLVIVEGWCPCAVIDLSVLRVYYAPDHRLVTGVV